MENKKKKKRLCEEDEVEEGNGPLLLPWRSGEGGEVERSLKFDLTRGLNGIQ